MESKKKKALKGSNQTRQRKLVKNVNINQLIPQRYEIKLELSNIS